MQAWDGDARRLAHTKGAKAMHELLDEFEANPAEFRERFGLGTLGKERLTSLAVGLASLDLPVLVVLVIFISLFLLLLLILFLCQFNLLLIF